jgi:hypothetical protein
VRSGLQLFVVAVKNCALYPENSKIRRGSLDKLEGWFTRFLDEHESLKLFVDLDSFLFQGIQVFQEKPGESAMVFPYFRDGVQWIEFMEGMEAAELETLIEKMNRFRMLREEDEDDLVTALWEADLQNIKYKTANEFWEIDPITEIASFKVAVGQAAEPLKGLADLKAVAPAAGKRSPEANRGRTLGALLSWIRDSGRRRGQEAPLFPPDGELVPPDTGLGGSEGQGESQDEESLDGHLRNQPWAVTPQEKAQMERLLSDESRKSHLGLGIDLTLALLHQYRDADSQGTIMKFLAEMVKFAFARGDFGAPILILGKLEGLIRSAAPELDSIRAEFPRWLATEPVMEGLAALEPAGERPAEDAVAFHRFLTVLPADAHRLLGETAAKCRDETVRSQLLGAVADRAASGGHELGLHLNTVLSPQDLSALVGMLRNREIRGLTEFLTAISRHVQRPVREVASRILLERNTDLIASVPHLLAEPDPALARQIYWQLGQRRSPVVEKAILTFLSQTLELGVTRSHELLLMSYRTLGLACATRRAADFASDVLLRKDVKALFGISGDLERVHRAGAALALHFIPASFGAEDALARASRSVFRSLRAACVQAAAEAEVYRAMLRRA